jgi:hypothetical protein
MIRAFERVLLRATGDIAFRDASPSLRTHLRQLKDYLLLVVDLGKLGEEAGNEYDEDALLGC